MTLAVIWFILLFVLLGGYAVLDGFDLGVGAIHLLAKDENERRVSINAIGPVWDGNEVWLLTGGGALFAAFPAVYATVFSGFYLALMVVLMCLMFRAIAMEFRGKVDSAKWRGVWDVAFSVSSILLPVLFGVAFGNVLRGVPLAADGTYSGTFLGLLNPYAVLIGVLTLVTFAMHGAIFLAGKSDGRMQLRLVRIAVRAWGAFVLLFVLTTVATALAAPALFQHDGINFAAWLFMIVIVAACFALPGLIRAHRFKTAMFASGGLVASLMGLAASGLFPRLLPSITEPGASLTIYNASSTPRTLAVMLVIALIGMPLVIVYTAFIYRVFHGKVVLSEDSY
ncbi:cytochrome d ubiquinol oxidase subunit II [soil metagenome]